MSQRDIIIETKNLTKVYRDFWGRPKVQALKALDLQVHRGEIFGLLGPNGSGKTTTIKLLLGLLFPTEGEALIFNEPTTNVKKNERIGYLPEESYLYKFLNGKAGGASVRRKRVAGRRSRWRGAHRCEVLQEEELQCTREEHQQGRG